MSVKEPTKLYFPEQGLCMIWAFVILTPLIYFPAPSVLMGHPWKVELTLSFILFLVTLTNFKCQTLLGDSINPKISSWILVPLALFIAWSALSILWADSTASVLHHTLIWAGYLIFFLFLTKTNSRNKLFRTNLIVFTLIVAGIAAQCVIEYTFSARLGEVFGFRFSRYAEIFAAVLPLFFSFILRLRGKYLYGAVYLAATVWLAVLFSTSRASFFSAVVGLGVFVLLRFSTKIKTFEKKRLIFGILGLICITVLSQLLLLDSEHKKDTALTRLVSQHSDDTDNSLKTNVRFLFADVSLEMFNANKLVGVGADNFGLEFNKYRAIFSADVKNKDVAAQQEALFPERTHNEFLQILTELGVVGGIIFLYFIFGVGIIAFMQIKYNKSTRCNILTHAAIAGIAAFLFSSLFSSFSFRLMQNGIVFFFLLALLIRNFSRSESPLSSFTVIPRPVKAIFAAISLILCCALCVFSLLKATSQYLTYAAETEQNFETAENLFQKAIMLDPANASANYSFGMKLLSEGKYQKSSEQLQVAVDKGLNTTVFYSQTASAQILAGDYPSAEKTLEKTIEIFPYSTFAQTRYASILQSTGKTAQSEKHFQIAAQLNAKQAVTWRTFINAGALAATKFSFVNKDADALDKLSPAQVVPLIQAEREILHPEEIVRFDFSK